MYKVLVVDDEYRQREGIIKHVDWRALDVQQVEGAENGIEALEIAQNFFPDILITDIRMEGMDGLELIEGMSEVLPNIKSIIISGYDEFEYARAAVELKAQAYLLKPLSIQKLQDELKKLIRICEDERSAKDEYVQMKEYIAQSRELLIDKFLKDLLYGNFSDSASIKKQLDLLEMNDWPVEYHVAIFSIIRTEPDNAGDEFGNMFLLYKLQERISRMGNKMFTLLGDDKFVLFISAQQEYFDLIYDIKRYIHSMMNAGVTVGVSSKMHGLAYAHEAFEQASKALLEKFYIGDDRVILYKSRTNENTLYSIDELYKELLNCIGVGDCDGGGKIIEEIFKLFSQYYVSKNYIKIFCFKLMSDIYRIVYEQEKMIEDIFGNENMIMDKMYRFDTIVNVKTWIFNIIHAVSKYIGEIKRKRYNHVIEKIKEILDERYQEEFSIEYLAGEVFLSPNYLCNLFKEEIGVSIIEYLTTVRIEAAKKILKSTDRKIYEIAESTGFNSASYFSNVFKSAVGMSPKEFRES